MLLSSDRHRPNDLALWRELAEADLIHGERLMRSGKVSQSIQEIRDCANSGPCHLCFSGGKDSTALLALATIAGVELPAVWFRAIPKFNPDIPMVREAVESATGVQIDVIDYDSPVPVGLTSLQAETIASENFLSACRNYQSSHGRRILGIRADESFARKIRTQRWGLTTKNSCAPLGWWTLADVFGFLAVRDLPIHPVYAMLGAGRWPRESIRVDALMGERGDGRGRRQWEIEYYGDAVRRLEAG